MFLTMQPVLGWVRVQGGTAVGKEGGEDGLVQREMGVVGR